MRPRLITSRQFSGEAIGDGVAVADIGVGAALATATAGIGGGAAADGGGGRLPDTEGTNIETDRTRGGGCRSVDFAAMAANVGRRYVGSRAVSDGPRAAPAPWPPA